MLQIHAERQVQRSVTGRRLLTTARASRAALADLKLDNAETLLGANRAANALHASIMIRRA